MHSCTGLVVGSGHRALGTTGASRLPQGPESCSPSPRCLQQRPNVVVAQASRPGSGRPQGAGRKPFRPGQQQKQQEVRLDAPDVEVPEVGWMWQTREERKSSGQPSAFATVASLKQDRIKAKKSLGQNFVTDDGVLVDIVQAAKVKAGDIVLEVGPGTGNLTKHLISAGARVTAVEKDDTLYARLTEQYKEEPNLRLVNGDVLRVALEPLLRSMLEQERGDVQQEAPSSTDSATSTSASSTSSAAESSRKGGPSKKKIKVVANLPYNITRDFMKRMLPLGDMISELSIMIQEEAAQRLVSSKPGDRDYRAMNLRVLLYSRPKYKFIISRFKYDPVPGVDGALVTFELIPPSQRKALPSDHKFLVLLNKAFGGRRKMLRNSLQPLYSQEQVDASLTALGLNPSARAQDLSLDQWVALCWELHNTVLKELGVEGLAAQDAAAAEAGEGEEEEED